VLLIGTEWLCLGHTTEQLILNQSGVPICHGALKPIIDKKSITLIISDR